MTTLLVAAIHRGELDDAPARQVIESLRRNGQVGRFVEVTEQPQLIDQPNRSALIAWRREQRVLERRWRHYLGQRQLGSSILSMLGQIRFEVRVRLSRSFASRQWQARQIEQFVTAKHIAAWHALLDGDEDELLVLESDATVTEQTNVALGAVLSERMNAPRYVNLAGGLDHANIAIDGLVDRRTNAWIEFRRPVTNTSCAYVLNRAMADVLVRSIDRDPPRAQLGVDWLINAAFLDLEPGSVVCWHADPPALMHGSLTGVTKSWHPDR